MKWQSASCHVERVVGLDWLRVREVAWIRVVEDKAKRYGYWKVVEAWCGVR